jgi:hypothetical protein
MLVGTLTNTVFSRCRLARHCHHSLVVWRALTALLARTHGDEVFDLRIVDVQTPRYQKRVVDDGRKGVLQLSVELPGVNSATELDVKVFQRSIHIKAHGKYRLVSGLHT